MSKYRKQNETLYKKGNGWYVFRDLEGDGLGEYLYKCFQYSFSDPKTYGNWIDPYPQYNGGPVVEYFPTKEEAFVALANIPETVGV